MAKKFNTLETNLQSLLDVAYNYIEKKYPGYDLSEIKTWDDSFAIPYGSDYGAHMFADNILDLLNNHLAKMENTDVVKGRERELTIEDEGDEEQIYVAIWS